MIAHATMATSQRLTATSYVEAQFSPDQVRRCCLDDLALYVQGRKHSRDEYAVGVLLSRMTEVAERMVAAHSHIVDVDDLLQVARLAVLRAAEIYDPDRGSFLAIARTIIRRRLIDFVRSESRGLHMVRGGDAMSLALMVQSPEPGPLQRAAGDEAYQLLIDRLTPRLSPLESKVLPLLVAGMKPADIAVTVGSTKKSIWSAVGRLREKAADLKRLSN